MRQSSTLFRCLHYLRYPRRQLPRAAGEAFALAGAHFAGGDEGLAVPGPFLRAPAVADAARLVRGGQGAVFVAVGLFGDEFGLERRRVVDDPVAVARVVGGEPAAGGHQQFAFRQARELQRLHVVLVEQIHAVVFVARGAECGAERVAVAIEKTGVGGYGRMRCGRAHDGRGHRRQDVGFAAFSGATQCAGRADAALRFVHLQQHRGRAAVGERPGVRAGAEFDAAVARQCLQQRGHLRGREIGDRVGLCHRDAAVRAAIDGQREAELFRQIAEERFFPAVGERDLAGHRGCGSGLAGQQDADRGARRFVLITRGAAGAGVVADELPILMLEADRFCAGGRGPGCGEDKRAGGQQGGGANGGHDGRPVRGRRTG